MPQVEPLGILGIEGVHYYVRDLERSRRFYVDGLDFSEIGESSPELTTAGRQRSVAFQAGGYIVICSTPDGAGGRAERFLKRHPDGVGTLAFRVENAARTFELLERRGGTPIGNLERFEDATGTLKTFSITTPFGDTTFRFIERRGYGDLLPGYVMHDPQRGGQNASGILRVDHITTNFQTMMPALLWLEYVLGFQRLWDVQFHTRDVARFELRDGSGLRSVVMWDPRSSVKFANNEPYRPNFKSSQINAFTEEHRGDGIQHLALEVSDILTTVRRLRARGVEFMRTPGTYYDALPRRLEELGIGALDEDLNELQELEILVDGHGKGSYMLQIFLKDSAGLYHDAAAGPFFYELIQRKGDQGFGAGNFRALFESIEREQEALSKKEADVLERQSRGRIPDAPHTQLKAADGRLLYEHCITRQGFDGPYTIAYHEQRPHEAQPAADAPVMLPPAGSFPERLLRRHYTSPQSALELEPFPRHRGRLLENADVALSLAMPTRSDAAYFANADGDELYFIHSGSGTLRTLLGDVSYRTGDYVYVPRSLLHRFVLDAGATQHWLVLELRSPLTLPVAYRNSVGQLRMDAPYSHRDFRAPTWNAPRDEGLRALWLKTQGTLQKYQLPASPLDVVGWDGSLYPFAFSIDAFKPKVGKIHLPPPAHATFEAHGVLICSFVPRPLDFHEQAVPCPYPHSSVDVDEVLFYSRGTFTSRRGVGPGSISHHPRGIPHGPHPGTYEASVGAKHTDELAVMLDCEKPLTRSALAESLEDTTFHGSFVASAGNHSTG